MMHKEFFPRVTVDQDTQFGKPVIVGTRVTVEVIVGHMAAGMAVEEVMKEYDLAREDVMAALKYASKVVAEERVFAS